MSGRNVGALYAIIQRAYASRADDERSLEAHWLARFLDAEGVRAKGEPQ